MIYSLSFTENVPTGSAGCTSMYFIRIRPAYRDDKPLLFHEIYHVDNFWLVFLISAAVMTGLACGVHQFYPSPYVFCPIPLSVLMDWVLYKIPRFRLWEEVQAYKVQIEYIPGEMKEINRRKFSNRISTRYGLKISEEDAYILLGQ